MTEGIIMFSSVKVYGKVCWQITQKYTHPKTTLQSQLPFSEIYGVDVQVEGLIRKLVAFLVDRIGVEVSWCPEGDARSCLGK